MDGRKQLQHLINRLIMEVKCYGILEISIEQYKIVCNSILKYAETSGKNEYTPELMASYSKYLDERVSSGAVCAEYRRFQVRVMRMLSTLAETGKADFSRAKYSLLKYPVSNETAELVEQVLNSYSISDKAKKDLRAPTRHLLWYAAEQGVMPEKIDDALIMRYLISEVPTTNSGSTGRTLRCVKYTTEYLKKSGNQNILRDYSLLKLKNDHRRIVPAFLEEEITEIVDATNTEKKIEKRDRAILLVAYCTGLRGIDITEIKLSDIDWRRQKISAIQSKTHTPIICELNGTTMNAMADYILDARPECDVPEAFVTVKAPYRKLSKGFGSMIDKYCERAGVQKITFRGFHSIRRSFETIMVSRGIPIETASQMMGHKTITEDKPYITYNRNQSAFVAMDFTDVPITRGIYAAGNPSLPRKGDGRS